MKLYCVTFTGADDSIKPEEILRVAEQYPSINIEWALLLSKQNEGTPRFPSLAWMTEFVNQVKSVAVHVQGRWLRSLLEGDKENSFLTKRASICDHSSRIQLNFHGDNVQNSSVEYIKEINKPLILPIDGTNTLFEAAINSGVDCYPLFDRSAGAGISPESWPLPVHPNLNGYAGGLGPENIKNELKRIEETVGDNKIWIDMETHIRSKNDYLFDLDKIRVVLDVVVQYCSL